MRRVLILTLLAAAIVSCTWFASRALAQWALQNWVDQQERLFGRRWTCGAQTMSGFPFRLDYACSDVAVAIAARRGPQGMRAPLLQMTAFLHNPLNVNARLHGPLEINDAASSASTVLDWRQLAFEVAWSPTGLQGLLVSGHELTVQRRSLLQLVPSATLSNLRLEMQPSQDQRLTMTLEANGGVVQAANALTGSDKPLSLALVASLDKSEYLFLDDLLASLDDWRLGGGQLHISRMSARQGDMTADISGAVGLDAMRRIRGELTISTSNVDEVLKRYGINPAAASIGSALTSFFARREPAPEPAQQGRGLTLPLTLKDGRAFVGPVRLPVVLLPLY